MKKNNKGFTLAEMLIVVAIIGVLIAILVPTFSAQLKKAEDARDGANNRIYATEAMISELGLSDGSGTSSDTSGTK